MEISKSHRKTVGTGRAEFTRDFKPGKTLQSSEIESAQIPEPLEKTTPSSKTESVESPRSRWKAVDTGRTGFTRDLKTGKTSQSSETESLQIPEQSGKAEHPGRTESTERPQSRWRTVDTDSSGFTRDLKSSKTMQSSELESAQIPQPSKVRKHPSRTESAELPGKPRKTDQSDKSDLTQDRSSDETTEPDEFEFAKILDSFKKASHSSRTESVGISKSHQKTVDTGRAGLTRDFKRGKTLQPSEIELGQTPEPSKKSTPSGSTESVELPRSRWRTADADRAGFTREVKPGRLPQSSETESSQIYEPSGKAAQLGGIETVGLTKSLRKTVDSSKSGFTREFKSGRTMLSSEIKSAQFLEPTEKTTYPDRAEYVPGSPRETVQPDKSGFTRGFISGRTRQSSEMESAHSLESSERAAHSGRIGSVEYSKLLQKTVDSGKSGFTRELKSGRTVHSSEIESAQFLGPSEKTTYPERTESARGSPRETIQPDKSGFTRGFISGRTRQSSEMDSTHTRESSERVAHSSRIGTAEHSKSLQKTVDSDKSGFTRDFRSGKTMHSSEDESAQFVQPSEKAAYSDRTVELPRSPRKTVQSDKSGFTRGFISGRTRQSSEVESAHTRESSERVAHSSRIGSAEHSKSFRKTVDSGRSGFTRDLNAIQSSEIETAYVPEAVHSGGSESEGISESHRRTVGAGRAGYRRDLQASGIRSSQALGSSERAAYLDEDESVKRSQSSRKTVQSGSSASRRAFKSGKTLRELEIESEQDFRLSGKGVHPLSTETWGGFVRKMAEQSEASGVVPLRFFKAYLYSSESNTGYVRRVIEHFENLHAECESMKNAFITCFQPDSSLSISGGSSSPRSPNSRGSSSLGSPRATTAIRKKPAQSVQKTPDFCYE
ncbi:unnamed protein product [Gongylonema pulchrum]|uniref:Smoothelin domain-containing protein n=1 Tax=Gongylonema pulchrum TaxID=637853 RepID=A0A183D2R3_9BILA|nr:unnamed protein product [Gongylonema pulchrum]